MWGLLLDWLIDALISAIYNEAEGHKLLIETISALTEVDRIKINSFLSQTVTSFNFNNT